MTATDAAVAPPRLRRPFVLASVMAAMFMIAVEATIVSTAMPQIVGQLGGLTLYAWVFSAFLLAQTATTVVFGKLADLYGRRPVMLVGIAIFLVGSLLCGFATSMVALIIFRLVQGIGAGAIQPIGLTVVGDLYSVQERGKIQGYLASVWGISSVLGPLAGGLIISQLSWAWIFWINIPVGLFAAVGFTVFLRENVSAERRRVDVAGALLFTVSVTALMLALTEAGDAGLGTVVLALVVFAGSAVLFIWQEARAPDPMLDIRLWSLRPVATSNLATLLSGMVMIGLTTFLPIYVQAVLGRSPLVAGFALTMMVLGWPIGATVSARNFARFGLRNTLLAGAALLPVGAVAFPLLSPGASPILAGVGSAVVGLGMGVFSTAAIVIVQESVGWTQRGAATAANVFSHNLGSTLGAAALGLVLNLSLRHAGPNGEAVEAERIRALLDHPAPDGSGSVAAAADPVMQAALAHGLHLTFWAVFVISALTLLLATLVPAVAIKVRAAAE